MSYSLGISTVNEDPNVIAWRQALHGYLVAPATPQDNLEDVIDWLRVRHRIYEVTLSTTDKRRAPQTRSITHPDLCKLAIKVLVAEGDALSTLVHEAFPETSHFHDVGNDNSAGADFTHPGDITQNGENEADHNADETLSE